MDASFPFEEDKESFSSDFEGFSAAQTDQEVAVTLTPRYSTFKKLEVVNSRRINFLARVYHSVSFVALLSSTIIIVLAQHIFSEFIEGLSPNPLLPLGLPNITTYRFPSTFTLVDSILSFLAFSYSVLLLGIYSTVILRQGNAKILNEQTWVIMLLSATVLYLNPYEAATRLRQDVMGISPPANEDGFNYVHIFMCVRLISFSVIYILYLWMGTHSYRYLDGRISFREWRFYIPKVVTLLAYNLYKICIIFKYGIRFAELPFASFISFITLYASVGQWPKLGVITVMILTGIELTILVLICFDIFKTMRALREAKYTDHRTQILGFRFFLHQQLIFNVVYISTYLLILFALPNGSQVTQLFVRSESTEKLDGRGSYFDAQYLPFGLLLCVLAFATTEAYTNLPADVNLRQLFFSCTFRTDDEQEPLLEPVVYRNREPRSFTGQYIDIRPNCFVMQTNIELFNLSWFVYYHGTKKENSLKLDFKEISLKIRDYLYDQDTDTRVIIAESSDRIIFAFKGTSSTQNLFTDMKVIHNSLAQVVEHGSGRVLHENNNRFELLRKSLVYRRAKVHAGFEEAYCTIKERLRVITTKLLAENNRPFFFTGHSLGGALATLSSLDISLTLDIPPSRIAVSTFGSPRVGNKAFQELYDSEIKMNWRVVAGGDLISRLPKIGYRHVGKKVILTSTGELFIDPSALEMVFWHSQSASIVHHRKACYLLALRAWCNSLGGDYVPKFWPFPVSKNDSRKFDTTFKKPLSQGFSQHTFGRRRNNKDHGAKMQLFSDAIDALKDNITEPSENSIVLWSKLVKLALQENNEDDSKQ